MTKQEFFTELQNKLSGLPKQDVEERLAFYEEMIDDRVEEGRTEEEAIADIGSVEEISSQIISDIPLTKIAKERIKPKHRLRAWEIVLLILGSPIWLSLGVAVAAVILSLYAVLWSVIVSLWSVFVSLGASVLGGVMASIIFISTNNAFSGICLIGVVLVCAGLAIFMFFGCMAATKGILILTKKIALGIKKCFVGKERA